MNIIERVKNLFRREGKVSDGFHTFDELYDYRMVYNALAFNQMIGYCEVYKSTRHSDGEYCFGGNWFVVVAELPTGQVTNHYHMKYWDLFRIPIKEKARKYDGHTPSEAYERLYKVTENESRLLFNDNMYWAILETVLQIKKVCPNSDPIIGGSLSMALHGYEREVGDIDIVVKKGTFGGLSITGKNAFNSLLSQFTMDERYEKRKNSSSETVDGKDIIKLSFKMKNGEEISIDIIESEEDYVREDLDIFEGLFISNPEQTNNARKRYIEARKKKAGPLYEETKWEAKIENYERKKKLRE